MATVREAVGELFDQVPEEWFSEFPEDLKASAERNEHVGESHEAYLVRGKIMDWQRYMAERPRTTLDKVEYLFGDEFLPECFVTYMPTDLRAEIDAIKDVRVGKGSPEWEALSSRVVNWISQEINAVNPGEVPEKEFVERVLKKDCPDWLLQMIPAEAKTSRDALCAWADAHPEEMERQKLPDMGKTVRRYLYVTGVNKQKVIQELKDEGLSGEAFYRALPLALIQRGGDIRTDDLTNYCMNLHDLYGSTVLRYDKK